MAVCVPTYMLASGLIAGGMNWWQAIVTILLGNLIVLVPMVLNAHAGTKYGIPFPVFVRASFRRARRQHSGGAARAGGLRLVRHSDLDRRAGDLLDAQDHVAGDGAHAGRRLDLLLRVLAAQHVGGLAGHRDHPLSGRRRRAIPARRRTAAAVVDHRQGGRPGPGAQRPSKFHTNAEFFRFFIPSLTGMVGFWATVALNIPDFTRYAKSQKAQVWGQVLGLPTTMTFYSFIGVAVTSASVVLFGEPVWDPVDLLGRFNQPLVAFIALIALLIATLTTNVAANVVSPSNDFSNLNPRRISFRTGGMITGVVGIAMMPWKLLSDQDAYIFGWLVGYSALLGPIAGVMIADYFLVRRSQLKLDDLYRRGGLYEYSNGINPRAVVALVTGIAVALLGLAVPPLRLLYDYAWFVGFGVSGAVYVMLMKRNTSSA